jgi:hypothetical protein
MATGSGGKPNSYYASLNIRAETLPDQNAANSPHQTFSNNTHQTVSSGPYEKTSHKTSANKTCADQQTVFNFHKQQYVCVQHNRHRHLHEPAAATRRFHWNFSSFDPHHQSYERFVLVVGLQPAGQCLLQRRE